MSDKLIVVLGGGESGVGTAILAQKMGFRVFLSDSSVLKEDYKNTLKAYNISFEEEGHTIEKILEADEVIKSPGIPDTILLIKEISEKGINIISEIEFAARYTKAKLICVTGSNGKTTTTTLIYHILKSAGLSVGLAGNIGKSFARQIAENNYDYYVLELSSFQLDRMYDFRADVAVLLNITPDHLDRYNNNFQDYIDSKMRIIRNQRVEDSFIYWEDDPVVTREIEKLKPKSSVYPFGENEKEKSAGYTDNGRLYIKTKGELFNMELELLALEGMHNVYNSLASGIVAKLMDVTDEQLRESLADFKGVPHRLEKVATIRGVQYINDSKATNVNSCWYALQSVRGKIVLILGGVDKGNDYTEIEELVVNKVNALIFLGKDNSKLHEFFDGKVETIIDTDSMSVAVESAYKLADRGETVLLSPCCASFDLFKDYEDRGEQFKECVRRL